MIEIFPNLHIGDGLSAVATIGHPDWFVISAAKEPWHRDALKYTGRAAPRDHPEYLMARREGHLILNLIDAADMVYIPPDIINAALDAISENIAERKVLVHCNQGHSRSPTIALLYLATRTDTFGDMGYDEAVSEFTKVYPDYAPAKGMADYARHNWRR